MLLDRLLRDLELSLQAFAICEVSPGWRLRLEPASWVSVHFVLAGTGQLRLSTGPAIPMRPHSLVLIPADRDHSIETGKQITHEGRTRAAWASGAAFRLLEAGPREADDLVVVCGRLRANVGTGQGLFDRLEHPLAIDFADSPEMVTIFERLAEEDQHRSATTELMMTTLMNEALILLFRRLCADPACPLPWLSALEDPRLSTAVASMLDHPERHHSVESLAAASLMSRTAFATAFAERFGHSPMAYLRQIRMRRAARLLRDTDLTVEQVAERVGYASRSQFSRAFSVEHALAPAAYRQRSSAT